MRAHQAAAHIQACGVDDAHTLGHQGLRLAQLKRALQLGQLRGAVDACHLGGVGNLVPHHRHPIGHRELDHVGQVELLLGVVVV